jgi:RNA polymerase sigma-70 factor (ECF subfamily)
MEVALVLREVFEFGNAEAAALVGLTESVFRHHLGAARRHMEETFEGLCALVNKGGACYQCKELRDLSPEGRRGPVPPATSDLSGSSDERWRKRLTIVRNANLADGQSRALHDLLFRWIGTNALAPGLVDKP